MDTKLRRCSLSMFFYILLFFSFTAYSNAQKDQDSIRAEINQMIKQSDSLRKAAQYDSAIVIGKIALEKAEIEFGKEDTTVARVVYTLGNGYHLKAEYDKAEMFLNRALAISEKILGSEHPDVASSLNSLGALYFAQGKYVEAEQLHKRALSIHEKVFGSEHQVVAASLHSIARIYYMQGKYTNAEPLFKQALAIREKVFGPEHQDVAASLNGLGGCYFHQGEYAEAEPLLIQVLSIREKVLGLEHPDVVTSMANLAFLYDIQGKYAEAEPLSKRALIISEKTLGPEHPTLAKSLHTLAGIYENQGKYDEAERLSERALSIYEKVFGPEHQDVGYSLASLGNICYSNGKYGEAELFYKRSLVITEKVFGPEHPEAAKDLVNIAIIYRSQGKYAESQSLYRRAQAIFEKALGPEHLYVAQTLNNLANTCYSQGKYVEAEALCRQALPILERDLGSDHPLVASNLSILASIYYDRGKYIQAESLWTISLRIREEKLGPEHLAVAFDLRRLAKIYVDQGKYIEAEQQFKQALAISEKTSISGHPRVTASMENLATFYCTIGEIETALEYYRKSQETRQNFIDYIFSNASENLKMSYIQEYPLIDNSFFSFAFLDKSTEAIRSALEATLKSKAVIIDGISAEKESAYCSYDEELIAKVEKHAEICGDIAALALAGAERLEPEIYKERLQTLYHIKDSLETELSRDCAEFRNELASRKFKVDDVAEVLPNDGVLLEIVQYEPYDFKKIGNDKQKIGPPRYLVFTLNSLGKITLTDLGDATEIDSLITSTRNLIYDAGIDIYTVGETEAKRRLDEVTSELYKLIIAPLESSIDEQSQVFISPDGQLSLLPFEILPDSDGKYVIEKYNISYLSSGRDLLRFKKKPEYSNWALAIADPDFNLSHQDHAKNRDKTLNKSEYTDFTYEPSRGTSNCLRARFNSLPYTKKETKSVVKTLKKRAKIDVDAYYGEKALEEVLKSMTISPRVLHLSTHGYFCEDIDLTENKMLENPLLRSGLVFAGANRLMSDVEDDTTKTDDGILTAFEVSGLNLTRTELVTLSACETGVGEVQNGEGVYGLRRAFQHAGARTILMSLWKIPDEETYDLMDNFYKNWLGGQTKQAALRQSALNILKEHRKDKGIAHPYYWGGFVLLGDPD